MIEYNFKVLSKYLSSLSLLIKTNISIFDEDGKSSDARNLNVYPFCDFIKDDVRKKCGQSDKTAIDMMRKQENPTYYYCHFGLIEMILKFQVDAKSHFYILIGPFRDPKKINDNLEHIKEYCSLFKKDDKELIKKYKSIPRFSNEKFDAIKEMISIIVDYAKTTKLIAAKDNFLENELDPFIEKNIDINIKVQDVCKSLFVTSKQLERIVKLYANTTPKKYILKYKITRAYSDILYTNQSLSEIASNYGFDDYNYFVRVFKKINGEVPSKIRQKKRD